jgi:hypothetical protein
MDVSIRQELSCRRSRRRLGNYPSINCSANDIAHPQDIGQTGTSGPGGCKAILLRDRQTFKIMKREEYKTMTTMLSSKRLVKQA